LKIAVMCTGYGLVNRGVETFLRGLMTRLVDAHDDWQFDVYTRASSSVEKPGIRLIHVPALSRYGRAAKLYSQVGHRMRFYLRTPNNAEGLSFAIAVAPKLARQQYDLVFNQAGPFVGWVLANHRRFGGPPFVQKTASGYSPLELILKRQRPDLTVATSPFVQDWLKSEPPDTRVICIPNAVDCDLFKPADNETGFPGELAGLQRPLVLFVGAMEPMKRPHLAIEAVSRLKQGSLVMIGDGSIRKEAVNRGGQTLGSGRFLSLAKVEHDSLPAYYRAANVFTISSEEPFGIVFLEALACNTPFVANDSPVQRWIASDAGLTCDCENAEGYASAIQQVLDTDYGDRPRVRAQAFDWKIIASEYDKAFRSVVESREPGRAEVREPVARRSR
jgi:glycosyltransferase involved in cell wall biosynthesis